FQLMTTDIQLSANLLLSSPLSRRHPRSTLIPYTTLFRSGRLQPCFIKARSTRKRDAQAWQGFVHSSRIQPIPKRLSIQSGLRVPDRKSTRLNSSHVKISYAVFCLKKKKIKQLQNTIN